MTEIKAIQTWYGGCYFRSRLEARWAVFFDALGIRWEHESEGYETPAGRYLPDLWLPDLRTRLEIKGEEPADDDLVRASYVADDAFKSGENFRVLIGGIPREPSTRTGPSCIPALTWMGPFSKDAPNAPWDIARGMAVANDQGFFGFLPSFWAFNRATLQPALTAARSARFEFGESGALRLHPTVKKPAGSPPVKPAGQLPLFGYDPDAKPYKYCPLHPNPWLALIEGYERMALNFRLQPEAYDAIAKFRGLPAPEHFPCPRCSHRSDWHGPFCFGAHCRCRYFVRETTDGLSAFELAQQVRA